MIKTKQVNKAQRGLNLFKTLLTILKMKDKRLKTVGNKNFFIKKVEIKNCYSSSQSIGRDLFVNAVGGALGTGLVLIVGAIFQYLITHPF